MRRGDPHKVSKNCWGLPHQCAYWFAMTRFRYGFRLSYCKNSQVCHCEEPPEGGDVAIRSPHPKDAVAPKGATISKFKRNDKRNFERVGKGYVLTVVECVYVADAWEKFA